MRLSFIAAIVYLVIGASIALGQTGGGGGGGGGGGAASSGGGGAASGGVRAPATGAPSASTAPNVPTSPAPGVANTPADPGRNNVDVNPPTRGLQGQTPATTRPPSAEPTPRAAPSDATTSQPQGKAAGRPGAAKSANSDGYSECMAMWNPSDTGESRDEWSKTCERTRLPPK
jgi:hypothetical protein